MGFGIVDKFAKRFGREQRIHYDDVRRPEVAYDRLNVADEIEAQLWVERCVDCVRHSRTKERVAIGGRPDNHLGSNIAASSQTVLDDNLLAEPFRQRLSDEAGGYVGSDTWRVAGDDVHRPCRIKLRRCDAR